MAWNAGSAAVLASPRAYTVGSGSGSPVFTVRVSGRVRVCWIFCRVGLTVYIRPDVHLYFHLWNCCDVIYPSLFLIFWVRVRVSIRHLLIKFVDKITSPQFHRWKLVLTFSSASRERRVKSLGTRLEWYLSCWISYETSSLVIKLIIPNAEANFAHLRPQDFWCSGRRIAWYIWPLKIIACLPICPASVSWEWTATIEKFELSEVTSTRFDLCYSIPVLPQRFSLRSPSCPPS